MKKNNADNRGLLLREIIIPIATIILSGLVSWIIAVHSNTHNVILDSQRDALQKEAPVLNKIADIAEKSTIVGIGYIEISRVHEVRVTTYMSQDSTIVGQDTSYIDKPVRDTTWYYYPIFIVDKDAFDSVIGDLAFIESHMDLLSHTTLKDVSDLLSFVHDHPITYASEKNEIKESEWRNPEVNTYFTNKVSQINQSYLARLKKFGLY